MAYSDTEHHEWSDYDPFNDSKDDLPWVDLSRVKVEADEDAEPNHNQPGVSGNQHVNSTGDVQILAVVAAGGPPAALGAPPAAQHNDVPPQGNIAINDYDSDDVQIIAVQGPSWSDYDSDELPDLVNVSMSSESSSGLPQLYQNQMADPQVQHLYNQNMNGKLYSTCIKKY